MATSPSAGKPKHSKTLLINLIVITLMAFTLYSYATSNARYNEEATISAMKTSVENLASTSRVYFTAQTANVKSIAHFIESEKMNYEEAFAYLEALRGPQNGYVIFSREKMIGCYSKNGTVLPQKIIKQDPTYKYLQLKSYTEYAIQAFTGNNPYNNNSAILFYSNLELRQSDDPALEQYASDDGYLLCYCVDTSEIVSNGLTEPNLTNSSSMVVDGNGIQIIKSNGNNIGSGYETVYKYFDIKVAEPEEYSDPALYTSARVAKKMDQNEPFLEVLQIKRVSGGTEEIYFYFVPLEQTAGWHYISIIPTASLLTPPDYTLPMILALFMLALLIINILLIRVQNRKLQRLLTETQSARIAAEEAREKADEATRQAIHANQSKSLFLSNMSHDIRTPMNAIVGMVEIAELNLDNRDRVEECLEQIDVSSQLLLGIINDVLDMSRIESGKVTLKREAFMMDDFITSIETIIRPQADEKHQTLHIGRTEPENACIISDHLRLQQIVVNILSNAVKYTPDGGHIAFTCEKFPQDGGKALFRLRAEDDGIGIGKEYQQHIFEAFSREDNTAINQIQGTGLGMAITHKFVTMMDGTITVDSTRGKGSTFTVELPLELCGDNSTDYEHITLTENIKRLREVSQLMDFGGMRILMAEDHPINRKVAGRLLTGENIKVDEAENGKKCVEKFAASAPYTYAAILMDIQMPEMNGYEACEAIRALKREDAKRIPIIALTANAFTEDIERAHQAGMNAHVAKPINLSYLNEVLTQQIKGEETK